jgi:hypothetical protein
VLIPKNVINFYHEDHEELEELDIGFRCYIETKSQKLSFFIPCFEYHTQASTLFDKVCWLFLHYLHVFHGNKNR